MANEDLLVPVTFQASRLDATVMPAGFSQAFSLYLLQQSQSNDSVAAKANQAAAGAYDAQVKNDEQDSELDGIGQRLSQTEQNVSSLDSRVGSAELAISGIQNDYVSKSVTTQQTLASPINVATSYSVGGTQVIGARVTGFALLTGTGYFASFNADAAQTISSTYNQSEVAAVAAQVTTARKRIKALEDALRAHGIIGV